MVEKAECNNRASIECDVENNKLGDTEVPDTVFKAIWYGNYTETLALRSSSRD